MTRKKEKGSKAIDQENSSGAGTEIEQESESEEKAEEIKLLEEKEHFQLEYFSKDDLVEKLKTLENKSAENEDSLKKLLDEKENWKNKFIRLQAEFENAQKRWDKSRQDLRTQYTASVLKNFLPLYDSFKKAIDTNPDDDSLKSFSNQLLNIFKAYNAEPIEVKVLDKFDYNIHEALSSLEKDDLPNNTILEIIQDGWKLGKNIIRYAKVITSREPKPPEPEPEPDREEEEKDNVDEKELDDNQVKE